MDPAVASMTTTERNRYYEQVRRERFPEKEQARKEKGLARLKKWQEDNPEKYRAANNKSSKKGKLKAKDLTVCETTEEIAAKVVKIAIDKVFTKIANAKRYQLRKELKEEYDSITMV